MANYSCIDKNLDNFVSISKSNEVTEDLQRLNLDINDELPKFKLDESGSAMLADAFASSIFQQNDMVDNESGQSFVVLGEASLDSITKQPTLSSFLEIQQKSNDTDHTSLISFMSPSEIEENLKKVFKENIKLKEILKQNNDAIRKQFNTITMWQKEVMAVCDNHKQKFLETKELISNLKKENYELREKIADNVSLQNTNIPLLLQNSNDLSSETKEYSIPKDFSLNVAYYSEENNLQNIQPNSPKNDQELIKKSDILSEDFIKVKVDNSKSPEMLQELEKRYTTDIELFNQQLQKANKELEIFKQKSNLSNPLESQKLIDKCCEKEIELKYLKEIVISLEQQIRKMSENIFPEFDLSFETSEKPSKEKCLLKKNVEFYNLKLTELGQCFVSQCSYYLRVQDLLKESVNIIDVFENSEVFSNSVLLNDKMKRYKDKLCNYRKRLIDEQLQSIDAKQTIIRVQKQFQKILSDYYSVIYELEILKDENSKLKIMQAKLTEESSKRLEEMQTYFNQEKKILDNEKTDLLEEKLNLQLEKKLVIEDKEKIKAEYNFLTQEKEKFIQERTSLLEERASLDLQSRLYEVEEGTLQKQNKSLQKKCENLTNEVERLKQKLKKNNVIVQQFKENENIVSAYKIQMEIYNTQLEEMYTAQKTLKDQLQTLSMINLELQTKNDILENPQNA